MKYYLPDDINCAFEVVDSVAASRPSAKILPISRMRSTSILNEILAPVVEATYRRSGRVATCQDGTREELLSQINRWIEKCSDQPICWLNGPAGSGKSAVSQSLAIWCTSQGILAASFFFLRGSGNRSKIARFIPTLAYELSLSIPATKSLIERTLQNEPSIFQSSFRYQLIKLIIDPIMAVHNPILATLTKKKPFVVVIDALDECDDKSLTAEFVKTINAVLDENRRLPIRVFLTSRVEEHLRKALKSPTIYPLALQDFDAHDDIRKFFRSRFSEIREENLTMRSIPRPWPSNQDLEALVRKSDGSFIVADTLVNFINDGTDQPYRRIRECLARDASLDALYMQVLSGAPRDRNFERVIGTIMLLTHPLPITSLGNLLQLETADVLQALLGVQSLIQIPGDDDQPARLFHTSFRDFLVTKSRSGDFFIHPSTRHICITTSCLTILTVVPEDGYFYGGTQEYASLNWCDHFRQGLIEGGEDDSFDSSCGATFTKCLVEFASSSTDFWVNTAILNGCLKQTWIPCI
jgi:AAA ATPase domain